MKAAVWRGKHDIRIEDVAEPELIHAHDAIVRVTLSAICASDLAGYHGIGMKPGDIVGHEFIGEIVEVGDGCTKVHVGDRVVVMCSVACGRCWFCKHERYAACDNASELYGHGSYAGGQAEYVRVPFADVGCLKIPPDVDDEQALFLGDLLPTAFMAAENCAIEPGDTVAIFGCGPVGQLAIKCALMLGADRVLAIDTVPERLAMAAESGAIELDEDHGDLVRRIDDLTGGRGPDACIDAVGKPNALRTAIEVARKCGTISIPSVCAGDVDKFPLGTAFGKGLRFEMGQTHVHKYAPRLLELVQRRDLDAAFIITHRITLFDLPRGYELLDKQRDGCIKVVARSP